MALNKTTLAQDLKTAFKNAKEQSLSSDQVADAISDAINKFVLGADVTGVNVTVVDAGNHQIGTGSQTGTGKLQ